MKSFTAPWGKIVTITTRLTIPLILVLPMIIFFFNPGIGADTAFGISILGVGIIAFSAVFMVTGYEIKNETLVVRRLIHTNTFRLAEIKSLEIDADAFQGSIRVFGNSGLFSICGRFWSRALGTFYVYVTDPTRAVVVKMRSRTIVVSPDDPEAFVRTIQSGMGSPNPDV